mmetsp:Transcript_73959/g.130646  ORF Transcript_73959/g.130646 Transcript_73959/m.130646 type:complete len:213 (+) Transcript_73959:694-1332(+)
MRAEGVAQAPELEDFDGLVCPLLQAPASTWHRSLDDVAENFAHLGRVACAEAACACLAKRLTATLVEGRLVSSSAPSSHRSCASATWPRPWRAEEEAGIPRVLSSKYQARQSNQEALSWQPAAMPTAAGPLPLRCPRRPPHWQRGSSLALFALSADTSLCAALRRHPARPPGHCGCTAMVAARKVLAPSGQNPKAQNSYSTRDALGDHPPAR